MVFNDWYTSLYDKKNINSKHQLNKQTDKSNKFDCIIPHYETHKHNDNDKSNGYSDKAHTEVGDDRLHREVKQTKKQTLQEC